MRSRTGNVYCSATKRFNMSDSMRRSSVCSKFMGLIPCSKAENHLGDDVLLDFVRATESGELAEIEILGRGAGGAIGPDLRAVVIAFEGLRDIGARVDAHGPAVQGGKFLTDLGAAYLQHRAFRAGRRAVGRSSQHAQIGDAHVVELDLDARQACGEGGILGKRLAVA